MKWDAGMYDAAHSLTKEKKIKEMTIP